MTQSPVMDCSPLMPILLSGAYTPPEFRLYPLPVDLPGGATILLACGPLQALWVKTEHSISHTTEYPAQ